MSSLNFDWSVIAEPLIKVGATGLGTLVGGPAGGAIGAGLGSILAEALGVPATPSSVADAIAANPGAVAAVERDKSAEIRAIVEQAHTQHLQVVNETMRTELASESFMARTWRPLFGICFCGVWTMHGIAIGRSLFLREFDVVARIPDLTIFYGVAGAVVGVYAWRRTTEKVASSVPEALGGLIGKAIKKGAK